ncbi:MAG TPA: PTS sugar transporter subunit IIA [Sediminispirochaeta sp.]|nr:PTS sugar transporter subunit IIA [Sediminispirochaeta sp.]
MLSPECIKLELKEKRKKKVILELSKLLEQAGKVNDAKALSKKVIQREAMASTGIGHGIAIPHCLTDMVDQTVMAFGICRQGIAFDAADNRPVKLIFLLAGPPSATSEHLKLLSKLSRLLTEESFRNRIYEVETPRQLIELFRQGEEA